MKQTTENLRQLNGFLMSASRIGSVAAEIGFVAGGSVCTAVCGLRHLKLLVGFKGVAHRCGLRFKSDQLPITVPSGATVQMSGWVPLFLGPA
jgi:hypothetical protein